MICEATDIALAILKTDCTISVRSAARNVVTAELDLKTFRTSGTPPNGGGMARAVWSSEQRKPYDEAYRRSVEALNDALKQVAE